MEKSINKIMLVSFVFAAFLIGYTVQVINTILSSSWGVWARLTDSDLITHGAPVIIGILFFLFLNISKPVKNWSHEVVVEISKVVWPSKKDTTALTIFVCFFMIISGIILGLFDFFSSQVIQFIIELS
jgi:preprotein translocase subunit SecE